MKFYSTQKSRWKPVERGRWRHSVSTREVRWITQHEPLSLLQFLPLYSIGISPQIISCKAQEWEMLGCVQWGFQESGSGKKECSHGRGGKTFLFFSFFPTQAIFIPCSFYAWIIITENVFVSALSSDQSSKRTIKCINLVFFPGP